MFKRKIACIVTASALLALSMTPSSIASAATYQQPVHCISNSSNTTFSTYNTLSINKKSWYRTEFKLIASAGNSMGYTYASTLLRHSLDDSPSPVIYSADSNFTSKIKATSEYQALLSELKTALNFHTGTIYTKSGVISINSNTDLQLAVHGMNYTVQAEKLNNYWNLLIQFNDVYNFDKQVWSDTNLKSSLVTFITNNAYSAQSCGAIVPYTVVTYANEVLPVSL